MDLLEERLRANEEVYFLESRPFNHNTRGKYCSRKRLYGLFCAHCHGEKGNGDDKTITIGGGYPAAPPAYNTLKDRKPGSVFHTITLMVKMLSGPHTFTAIR